jgi:glycogen debranching enzyme
MIQASHHWNGQSVGKEVRDPRFILCNRKGAFFYAAQSPGSKFEGLFTPHGNGLYHTLESLQMKNPVTAVRNHLTYVEQERSGRKEQWHIPENANALVFNASTDGVMDVVVDCRKAFDFRQFGRNYRVYDVAGTVVIEYIKNKSKDEDAADEEEFRLYVAIASDGKFLPSGNWLRRDYENDRKRNSAPERYVYHAGTLTASHAAFGVATSEAAALKEARAALQSKPSKPVKGEGTIEEAIAQNALAQLTHTQGIYAGLPWFFQHWARDTMISLGALLPATQKRIIFEALKHIGKDGRIPNISPSSSLGSADAIGWLFLRAQQLLRAQAWNAKEKKMLAAVLKSSLDAQMHAYGKENLLISKKNETWMDTDYRDDGREGACIEIQALTIASYTLLWELTRNSEAKNAASAMKKAVREQFWNNTLLADRAGDVTVRPNIFIAAYACPDLLSKKEWETAIANALKELWCDWGGVASISKNHALYQPKYTGENNQSYHRGDSWFWINNLAAIVMQRVNPKKFALYIKKIREASVKDLLWNGAIGASSELSSAEEQRAEGCLSQAWSAATLLELIREQ